MYLANMSLLKPGDILLSSQDRPVSRGVRKFTKSDYSHAALYVGGGSYIHSDANGVHSGNTQRWIFKEEAQLKVMRLSAPSKAVIDRAIEYSRLQIGVQYSVKEAIRTKIGPKRKITAESNRQFCSRLVAMAYAAGGLKIVEDARYCTPADIEQSPLLEEVPCPLVTATPEELSFANSESPLEIQARITNEVLAQFRKVTSRDIQQYDQAFRFLIDNPHFDEKFTEIVEASGYLELWKMELAKNPWRYDYDLFCQLNLDAQKKKEIAAREIEMAERLVERYSTERTKLMTVRSEVSLRFLDIHIELYQMLVSMHQQQKSVALRVAEDT